MPEVHLNDLHCSQMSEFIYVVYIRSSDGSVMYQVLQDKFGHSGLYNKKEFD